MAERKEYAYGRIGSDYAEIRCIGLGLNRCPGSGMAGRKDVYKRQDLSIIGRICIRFEDNTQTYVSRRYIPKIKKHLGI